MEAADAGQFVRIAHRPIRRLRRLMTRFRHGAEQQHAGRDAAVLVGAHAAGAQHFDGVGNAIGHVGDGFAAGVRRRIEECRDVAVLGQSAEELKTLRRQRLVGDELITRRQYHADAAQQPPFMVRQLRTGAQRVALAHPFELDLPAARYRAQQARHPLRTARQRVPASLPERNSECHFPSGRRRVR